MNTALSLENSQAIMDMLFNALSDEEVLIKKASLQIISQLLTKSLTKPVQSQLDLNLAKSKLYLYKLCFPNAKHPDPSLMLKSL